MASNVVRLEKEPEIVEMQTDYSPFTPVKENKEEEKTLA